MSVRSTIEEDTTPQNSDLLERLRDQLGDLLTIHMQNLYSQHGIPLGSLYLRESQYVCGEKSAAKSFMQFTVNVSPSEEAGHVAEETLILTFTVEEQTYAWRNPRRSRIDSRRFTREQIRRESE